MNAAGAGERQVAGVDLDRLAAWMDGRGLGDGPELPALRIDPWDAPRNRPSDMRSPPAAT